MAIDAFATSAYSTIVSWTYILLVILIIYKIITFFTGGRLWGRGGGGDRYNDSRRTNDGVSPEDEERRKEKDKNDEPEGLDFNNLGGVQVVVRDEDDNPIPGAKVSIKPAQMRKRRWLRTKKGWRKYAGLTNADGVWPGGGKYEQVGSGSVVVKVTKRNFFVWSWFRFGRYYQQKDYEIIGGEDHDIVVIMKRKGEKAEHFEPKVIKVEPIAGGNMRLRGIIK